MKKILFLAVITLLALSCSNKSENENPEIAKQAEAAYTPVTITLAEFDTRAGEFVDKEVKVQGIVDHVCKHGGKKLLLVNDDGDVHVTSDDRFDDELIGSEVIITGIVREYRVDEGECMRMEEDNIKSHKEGKTDKEQYEQKMAMIKEYRDEMKEKGVDHLSFYSLEFVSLEKVPEQQSGDI